MDLTADEVKTLRWAWARVRSLQDQAGELMYRRFFELAPDAAALFGREVAIHGRTFMAAMSGIIDVIDRQDRLTGVLRRLAHAHAGVGVKGGHYAAMGDALVWMLREEIGPAFTAEDEALWREMWVQLLDDMIAATEIARG